MQKKLIVLALAGLTAAPVFAQSNVTVYGRADGGFVSRSGSSGAVNTNGTKNEVISGGGGGSRFGFRGTEDLGSGLKALFQMEYNVQLEQAGIGSTTNGGANLASRNSYVGLTGGFGTALVGRVDGGRYGVATKYDPFGSGFVGNMASLQTHATRGDNALVYVSPTMSGFSVAVAYTTQLIGQENNARAAVAAGAGTPVALCVAADLPAGAAPKPGCFAVGDVKTAATAGAAAVAARKNNGNDLQLWLIKPQYENGPISITFDYEKAKIKDVTNTDLKLVILGGSYDFGVVKAHGYWESAKSESAGATPASGNGYVATAGSDAWDQRSWMLGLTAPIGAMGSLRTSYVRLDDKTNTDAAGRQRTGDCDKWSIGYSHNLSKRTSLYTDYARINNKSMGTCTISFSGATGSFDTSGTGPSAGVGTKGFDLGIAHTF